MSDITERVDRLESIIEDQQETIRAQQARIEELEADRTDGESDWIEENVSLSRRSAIKTLGLAGLLGYGTTSAAADPTGQVGNADRPVTAVYTEALAGGLTGGTAIDDLLGADLVTEETEDGTTALSADTVDVVDRDEYGQEDMTNPDVIEFDDNLDIEVEDGTVSVDADTSGNSQTDVSDDGSTVVESTDDIDFGTNLSASSDDDGTATVDANVSGATNWEDSDTDDLLEPSSSYTGIDVGDIQTDSLSGGVTGDTDLTSLSGDGLAIDSGALGIAAGGIGATELANNSVTIAGNSVPLGGSVGIDYVDLGDTGGTFPIPNGDLANSSLTVAGNAISLGGSTGVNYVDLGDTSASFPIANADIANSSLTVTAGDGLKNGGSVSLGGSTTLDVEPTDFAGTFLSEDGSDNLTVNLGSGVENDGSDNIGVSGGSIAGNALEEGASSHQVAVASNAIGTDELDPAIAPTWTDTHTWDTDTGANLNVDEIGLYYDTSSAETLDLRNNGGGSLTLQEDGTAVVTEDRQITAGHAIQSVPLGDLSANRTVAVDSTALSGSYLGAAGSNAALSVNLGNGVEGDGSNNIRVDGAAVAGNVLSANGSNPYQIDVNIGNGLEDNSGSLGVNPEQIAGTGLSEDGSNQLQIDATTIDHNNLINSDQSDAHHAKDHDHTEADVSPVPNAGLDNSSVTVTPGTGLSGGGSASLGGSTTLGIDSAGVETTQIASDAVTGTEINLADIAGDNIDVDNNQNELDAASAAFVESESTGLLEPVGSGITGIDVTDVQTDSLNGDVTGGTDLTSVTGTGLTISGNSLGISDNDVGKTQLNTPFADLSTLFGSSVTAGANIDLDGNNLVSSSGAFSITTGSGNLTLNPTSDIDASNNNLNNVASIGNGGSAISVDDDLDLGGGTISSDRNLLEISSNEIVTISSDIAVDLLSSDLQNVNRIYGSDSDTDFRIETETPSSDPVIQSAPDTANVSTNDIVQSELAFALDESNTDLDVYIRDSNDTAGTISIGSYSTERLKANVQPYAGKPETVLDIEAKTFTAGNGDGDDRLGITAESAHDAGLDWLVDYAPVGDALQTESGITDSYVEEYGIERDGETVVPNDIHDRAWLAMHHQLLREETETVSDHRARLDDLEAELAAKDARIEDQRDRIGALESEADDLREENERLRERNADLEARVERIEAELGLGGSNAAAPADD